MKSSEIRQRFIDYFKKNGHTHVTSSSLIPENDPTLLFANAGMNQFKNTFLGLEKREYKRAVTSQKCVRAGGKHNDLENVGFTARHHTFFEMLGNFSFGDYFKKDALHFAWELLTKELGIPKEKLYVTVFQNDDEAADIWHKQEGVPTDRIFRFGEKDNFWRMGDTGPCGPCSEIFYDFGPKAGKISDPFKSIAAGEDRYVEIWNNVFMQFYESAPGKMEPLPKPSVDTGAGLERWSTVLQGKINNYDTDLFMPMINLSCEISGRTDLLKAIATIDAEGPFVKSLSDSTKEDVAALRVLADHTRATTFLIADGALPSNEGRGYVLRRIMRRAIRYGRKLSSNKSFMPEISKVLIQHMSDFYPELKSREKNILNTIKDEEARFLTTLDQGTHIFNEELKKLASKNTKELPGDVVFKLYDTYGFPVDLTRVMATEKGFTVDEKKFEDSMERARSLSKASWKGRSISSNEAHMVTLAQEAKPTEFVGYNTLTEKSEVLLLSNGTEKVKSLKAGDTGLFICTRSPFYAEGGGQVGDQGEIKSNTGAAKVVNTIKKNDVHFHFIEVESGEIKLHDKIDLYVAQSERRQTVANHSATHLMHAALKKLLGAHVGQAGSLVEPARLRFDFTHNKPVSREEIQQLESLVNAEIAKAHNVFPKQMKYKEAITAGAVAMFGEKYGDEVRVVSMGDFSTELCGGTHVSNTAQIRVFKILSESGVSSGVRRIEAITGDAAVQYLMKNTQAAELAKNLTGSEDLQLWIEAKKEEIKNLEKEIKRLKSKGTDDNKSAEKVLFKSKAGDATLVFADLHEEDRDVLSNIADKYKNEIKTGVVIVIGKGEATHPMIVSVSKNLNPDISAGNLLKELATIMGGKGGGRPDFAQGAVPDRSQISKAYVKVKELLKI